jgi:hypothetical protein
MSLADGVQQQSLGFDIIIHGENGCSRLWRTFCGMRSSLHFWEQISVILVNRFSEAVEIPCQQAPLALDVAVRSRTPAK